MIRMGRKLVVVCAGAVVAAYAVSLGVLFVRHQWLLGPDGRPLVADFLAVWSAGGMTRNGSAFVVYDPMLLHRAEIATAGHDFAGTLSWPYPPSFLFVAGLLSVVGFAPALLMWGAAGAAAYAGIVAAAAKKREAATVALAVPCTLASFMVGQNGFLTAALLGGALLAMEKRPMLSGVLFGLLAYKPQFGILIPLALAAGGQWRCFAAAAASVLIVNGAAVAAFGSDTLTAFFRVLPQTADALVSRGGVGWGKLQSLYGVLRWSGTPNAAAWTAQGLLMLALAMGIVRLWRSRISAALKAATLAAAVPLATPYVFFYDLPVLAVAAAFLFRDRPFDRVEIAALGVALSALVFYMVIAAPFGFLAAAIVAAMTVRRYLASTRAHSGEVESGSPQKCAATKKATVNYGS
jgi:arabinofuranan 3-O-arabinosyltransferase